jgi:hypothetical protein
VAVKLGCLANDIIRLQTKRAASRPLFLFVYV